MEDINLTVFSGEANVLDSPVKKQSLSHYTFYGFTQTLDIVTVNGYY